MHNYTELLYYILTMGSMTGVIVEHVFMLGYVLWFFSFVSTVFENSVLKCRFFYHCFVAFYWYMPLITSWHLWIILKHKKLPLQVDTTKLTVNAGETAFVQIHSTVPITCREINGRRPNCFIRFEMLDFSAELKSTNLHKFCQDQKLTKSSRLCGVKFDGWNWGKSQTLTIPTKADQQIRGDVAAIVKLRSIGIDSDMLWKNYELPDIKVIFVFIQYPYLSFQFSKGTSLEISLIKVWIGCWSFLLLSTYLQLLL